MTDVWGRGGVKSGVTLFTDDHFENMLDSESIILVILVLLLTAIFISIPF